MRPEGSIQTGVRAPFALCRAPSYGLKDACLSLESPLSYSRSLLPSKASPPVEWRVSKGLTEFAEATAFMEARAEAIAAGAADELVWLIEHPPLYSAGTSARDRDLIDARFPVHLTGRGGQFTYHGPGQRIAYVMLDLKRRGQDVRAFVSALEQWIITTLSAFDIVGERRSGRVGVWVQRPEKPHGASGEIAEDKIAAIGVRVRRWVTFHGVSINLAPDLSHFSGIVPCGISSPYLGVTSFKDLNCNASMEALTHIMRREFETLFGVTI